MDVEKEDGIDTLATRIARRVMDRVERDGCVHLSSVAEEVGQVLRAGMATGVSPMPPLPSVGPLWGIDGIRTPDGKSYWDIADERMGDAPGNLFGVPHLPQHLDPAIVEGTIRTPHLNVTTVSAIDANLGETVAGVLRRQSDSDDTGEAR